jgi:hypothetical protein
VLNEHRGCPVLFAGNLTLESLDYVERLHSFSILCSVDCADYFAKRANDTVQPYALCVRSAAHDHM